MELLTKFYTMETDKLEIKENDICEKHSFKVIFTNELLKLPSGKLHWTGCPKCKDINITKQTAADNQLKYDKEKKQWFREIAEDNNAQPDFRTRGFRD